MFITGGGVLGRVRYSSTNALHDNKLFYNHSPKSVAINCTYADPLIRILQSCRCSVVRVHVVSIWFSATCLNREAIPTQSRVESP